MRRLVASARVGRLATTDDAGRPHAVPVCFALRGDVAYTAVDHKPKSGRTLQRVANITATRRACLLVDHYSDDWSTLWWVRLDGPGRLVDQAAERDAALQALAAKYAQYAARTPDGPVIAL